jgi:hypothetical protein
MEAAGAPWYRIRRLLARLFARHYVLPVANTSIPPR